MCTCYEVSIVQCVSCTFCSLLQTTAQHNATTRSITQHHATSRNITQHHTASRSITQHHAASHIITHYHTKDQHTKLHHQYQTQCISQGSSFPTFHFICEHNLLLCRIHLDVYKWVLDDWKKRENKKNVLQPVLKRRSSAGKWGYVPFFLSFCFIIKLIFCFLLPLLTCFYWYPAFRADASAQRMSLLKEEDKRYGCTRERERKCEPWSVKRRREEKGMKLRERLGIFFLMNVFSYPTFIRNVLPSIQTCIALPCQTLQHHCMFIIFTSTFYYLFVATKERIPRSL